MDKKIRELILEADNKGVKEYSFEYNIDGLSDKPTDHVNKRFFYGVGARKNPNLNKGDIIIVYK